MSWLSSDGVGFSPQLDTFTLAEGVRFGMIGLNPNVLKNIVDTACTKIIPKQDLSDVERQLIYEMLHNKPKDAPVLFFDENDEPCITVDSMEALNDHDLLHDRVMNPYLRQFCMHVTRAKGKVHVFKTDVYSRYKKKGYKAVQLETRPRHPFDPHFIPIFAHRAVFFPIQLTESHWALVVFEVQAKALYYLDSLSGERENGLAILQTIQQFLKEEYQNQFNSPYPGDLKLVIRTDIPPSPKQQDSGLYMAMMAFSIMIFYSLVPYGTFDASIFHFTSKDLPRIRDRMVLDLFYATTTQSKSKATTIV